MFFYNRRLFYILDGDEEIEIIRSSMIHDKLLTIDDKYLVKFTNSLAIWGEQLGRYICFYLIYLKIFLNVILLSLAYRCALHKIIMLNYLYLYIRRK